MRISTLALAPALAVLVSGAALAQSPAVVTPDATGTVGGPASAGVPGVISRQTGAVGSEGAVSYSPTGQPADTISNDSAAAGNANQPSRVAPQGGAGGGTGGSGGQ